MAGTKNKRRPLRCGHNYKQVTPDGVTGNRRLSTVCPDFALGTGVLRLLNTVQRLFFVVHEGTNTEKECLNDP
jgi:hypothetical protein